MAEVIQLRCGTRLTLIKSDGGARNWLYVPGGPGIECLNSLIQEVQTTGAHWKIDLPGNGSNDLTDFNNYDSWGQSLVDAVKRLGNTVVVGHSLGGGMLFLSMPELNHYAAGLVLLSSAPSTESLFEKALESEKKYGLTPLTHLLENILEKSSKEAVQRFFTSEGAPYFFSKNANSKLVESFKNTCFNTQAFLWGINHF